MITKTTNYKYNFYVTKKDSYKDASALEDVVYSIPNTIRNSVKKRYDSASGKWKVSWTALK